MGNQNINIFRDGTPKLLALIGTVHEAPIEKLWRVGRAKYADSLYLDHFVLQVCTNLFHFLYLLIAVERLILMLGILEC